MKNLLLHYFHAAISNHLSEKPKILSCFILWLYSLVQNSEDRFSRDEAHIIHCLVLSFQFAFTITEEEDEMMIQLMQKSTRGREGSDNTTIGFTIMKVFMLDQSLLFREGRQVIVPVQ